MNISIGRLDSDPSVQMVIQPEDRRWQLVVDKDGYPHLYIEVNVAAEDGEPARKGMLCIEDMLPDAAEGIPTTIRDLMDASFGDPCSPEEAAKAEVDLLRSRAETGIPCPRFDVPRRR